jgi:hypothetical protein
LKKSVASYEQKKQRLIQQFNGAGEAIESLENSIEEHPTASRAVKEFGGYNNYIKTTYVKVYDTLMRKKDGITIHYAVHGEMVILLDIF